ncbi:hypothetical protein [Sphingomonas sp.]|uniref:hypothetical protein n=1 Tax=Sphingomonas sp. TaxID=28214 RepID=UPI0038A9E569
MPRMFELKRDTRSAGEPAASVRGEPAAPAPAAGSYPPMPPAAAPAKALLAGIAAFALISMAVPAIAACGPGAKPAAGHCRTASRRLQLKPAEKRRPIAVKPGLGGGSTLDLRRLAPDLMP